MVQNEQVNAINILAVMSDPNLLGGSFQGDTWKVWEVFLQVLFGHILSNDELEIYTRHTGRSDAPGSGSGWLAGVCPAGLASALREHSWLDSDCLAAHQAYVSRLWQL